MSYEHEDESDSVVIVERGSSPIAAFLMGLAVGVGAALLMAPQSGAETRADIARQAARARRAATRFSGDVRERTRDAYENTRREMRRRARDARRGVEHAMGDVKARVDASREAGRAAARAAREELQRRLAETGPRGEGDNA